MNLRQELLITSIQSPATGRPARVSFVALSVLGGRDLDLPLQELGKRIGHLGASVVSDASGGALDVLHQPLKIIARVGDRYHANGSLIPKRAGVKLRHGDVKRAAQTVLEAARNLPFVLERVRRFDAKFEAEESDHA